MNCSDFQELISAKLDKELTPEEEKILAEHLETCNNCASLARKLGELKVIASNWGNIKIPVELEKQILNRTVNKAREKKPVLSLFGGYYRVPKGLAWALVLLFLILVVNSFTGSFKNFDGSHKIEKTVQEFPKVQKIILTENDMVGTCTILGKRN